MQDALIIIGSIVTATALVGAFVGIMASVLGWFEPGEKARPAAPRASFPDPAWWPDFERQFADYVERRDRGLA